MGIPVLPPSVNKSQAHFTVENGKIRLGLGAIKGAGLSAIHSLINTRATKGPFSSIYKLTEHLDLRQVGKKTLECMAGSGALDELEGHRAQLVEAVEYSIKHAQRVQADRAAGQNSLFGDSADSGFNMEPNLPMTEPWPVSRKLKAERELIGFYVSGHPLDEYAAEARAFTTISLGDTETIARLTPAESENGHGYRNGSYGNKQGPMQRFCGIVTEVQQRTTRSGKPIVFATIEDFTGQGEMVCFASEFDRYQQYLKVDSIIFVRGTAEVRGGSVKLKATEILPMWKVRELIQGIVLHVDTRFMEVDAFTALRELCDANRGNCKLYFDIATPDLPGGRQRIHSRKYVVEPTPDLMNGITRLFGQKNVTLESNAI